MTITEFIADTYLLATGKTTVLSTGNKFDRIVALGNFFQRRWAREPGINWNSLYDPAFSLGNITATDSFDIDTSSVRALSDRQGDPIRIIWTDGVGYTDYDLVPADNLKDYSSGATKQSPWGTYATRMGGALVFNHTFTTSDPQYGGEIFVPAYVFPDAITSDNADADEVQVDDPDWLVARVAAEYVRNDLTRRQRYPELLAAANEIMERMKEDNDSQISLVDRPWTPFSGFSNADA